MEQMIVNRKNEGEYQEGVKKIESLALRNSVMDMQKDNNSLSLSLILSVLQAELSNFDGVEEISLAVYCNFWLTLIKVTY
jgi:hypothetical protein